MAGLRIGYTFSRPDVHPYDEVGWDRRAVAAVDGSVEFPEFWSDHAVGVVATRYFRHRETSLRELIDRVVAVYRTAGADAGYFDGTPSAEAFATELTWLLLHQVFSFNSPVWFNVGTGAPAQVSGSFILSVADSLDSILDWYRQEAIIFNRGSGAGVNLSRLRSSRETLSHGGHASGPVAFMRGADSIAGAVKAGGTTRRAAKMVVLNVDHPDIVAFITAKAREEDKIRALGDAGFDIGIDGADLASVQFQNANNSVRVTDEFMHAVRRGDQFALRARVTGEVVETVDARWLLRRIAQTAWACGDPGIQYDDTINSWHTCPESGRITASNSCSEYMHLDGSACTLGSLNLMRFLDDDGRFAVARFVAAVELAVTAMDISVCFAEYPTPAIAGVTGDFRQLGLGYANLGALLMATGRVYDSPAARAYAAAITSLMTATAYRRSAELAALLGPYAGHRRNADAHRRVMHRHNEANAALTTAGHGDDVARIHRAAREQWTRCLDLGAAYGWRNAQASLIAPTGTIGIVMDCDTAGVEPDFALVKTRKVVGGDSMRVVNTSVARALASLGYDDEQARAIIAYIGRHGRAAGAPGLREADLPVFDCATGERFISPLGHLRMMAAIQPFLSGAMSKTVNLPAAATVDDIELVFRTAWSLGLKAVAVYRDGCKATQPVTAGLPAPTLK
jgi:ribonucleoside-diphosphate reductase alpha chain